MPSRAEHYYRAEALLAEGVAVVRRIADAHDEYDPKTSNARLTEDQWVSMRRDELGKKAMGIWAQAQVHATLAGASGDGIR